MADATQLIGAKLLTSIETDFIHKINLSIDAVQGYAVTVLFAIAALELVLFALAWVIKQDESLGMLAIKVLKIGIIFLFISSFPYILQQLIDGFTLIAFKVSGDGAKVYLFSPGQVWKIGLKAGVSMLKLAVEYGTYNVGMSFIYLVLGFGLLMIFALIGAQIILVVCVFYAMVIAALLLIPFGALKPFEDILHRAVQAVFKASVRVFGLILVLGVGYVVWTNSQMKLDTVTASTGIEKPLALFFSSLVILILAYKLPAMLADAVGKIRSNLFEGTISSPSVSVNTPVSAAGYSGAPMSMSMPTGAFYGAQGGGAMVASGSGLAYASSVTSTQTQPGGTGVSPNVNVNVSGGANQSAKGAKIGQATSVSSISDDTLRKLKATVKQAMNEKPSS